MLRVPGLLEDRLYGSLMLSVEGVEELLERMPLLCELGPRLPAVWSPGLVFVCNRINAEWHDVLELLWEARRGQLPHEYQLRVVAAEVLFFFGHRAFLGAGMAAQGSARWRRAHVNGFIFHQEKQ